MHSMHVLGKMGDARTTWDPDDPESVHNAERLFEGYQKARCLAFSVEEPGGGAIQIRAFDPAAQEIIVTHPLAGG